MGGAGVQKREILIAGLLSGDPERPSGPRDELEARFGPIALQSEPEPFHWTDYYRPEMGGGLMRSYVAFREPFDPAGLKDAKIAANEMEGGFQNEGGGPIFNIDPGLLSLGRLVLATTKDRAHRLPLGDGIFAELTLIFSGGAYNPLPWTYPDYASEGVRDLLARWRGAFFETLKRG